MRRVPGFLTVLVFAAALHAQAPVFRPLHVSAAGTVVDDLGHPVLLHGLNRSATGYGNADANATDQDYQQQNQLLSMNVVRIFVNSAWWTGNVQVPIANLPYQNYVDQLIQRAKKYGNYVLILKAGQFPDAPCGASGVNCPASNQGDLNCQANAALCFDQDTTGTYIFDALQFWSQFTQRYASDPAILYDTWENMRGLDPDTWSNNENELIATIRTYSPGALIFVGDTGTAFEAVVAGTEPDLAWSNIVWNFHIYNGPAGACSDPVSTRYANWSQNFDPLVSYAQQNGHAVVMSEWGGCNDTEPYHTNITSYARTHSVGLIYFDSSNLITVTAGTSQLTAVGTKVAQAYAGLTGCTYMLSAGGQVFPAAGGNGSIGITALPGCAWSASGAPNWVTGTTSGSGNGTLNYQVTANQGPDRSVTITVAGISFTIEQQASSIVGLASIGSMAHIAAEGGWTTAFTFVNKGASSAQTRFSLFGDSSDPSGNGPLTVPLAFPQQPAAPGPLIAASLDRTLSGNASLVINSAGPLTSPVLTGSAQLAATGAVDGFAVFRQLSTAQEAVVPLETRNASSYLLAFDNTGGVVMGVAVANLSQQLANIGVVIRDDTGKLIGPLGAMIALAGNGHTSFVLSDPVAGFSVTANIRGTIEFDAPPGVQISVLGIRSTPPNHALTTIPALVNAGTGGGSIAHIASGNGWQTTFVLVNTGTTAAQIHLKFFADATGAALSLPLSFPQPNGGAATVASSVDQTLAAGTTLLILSTGPSSSPLTLGSAQLTTNGSVGGFVIFRNNPFAQEAVVPLETRNANAYILAFDNTGGRATGIAINSVSSQTLNVPVVVRDDTGAQIATDTLTLPANAHQSFVLVTDKYPATANIRGIIEFDTPPGGQIGALGIRATGQAFTTLPALVK